MKTNRIYVQLPNISEQIKTYSALVLDYCSLDKSEEKDLLLTLKSEQNEIRKQYKTKFLTALKDILEKCFLTQKQKSHDFITKEKLTLEFLKLFQSQKRFKDAECLRTEIKQLAVFDKKDNNTGKLICIDLLNNTVDFNPCYCFLPYKRREVIKRDLSYIDLFDPFSIQFIKYYRLQKQVHDELSYEQTFQFLTARFDSFDNKTKEIAQYSLGRGIPLAAGVRERCENSDLNQ